MLNLEGSLKLNADVAKSPNLAPLFSVEDQDRLAEWVWDGYARDEQSREPWLRRNQAGMNLALQLQKQKSFPWPNASNVAFPLVTIAAMQFHARAYPALVSGTDIVKCRVPAPDPTGEAKDRAARVGQYMSYQVLEEDPAWEEQHDRLLLQLPIIGCVFVKTRRLVREGRNQSELVPAASLVMDYYAKSVETCTRKTHLIPFYRNEVHERCVAGTWTDITDEAWYKTLVQPYFPPGTSEEDKRKGVNRPLADESAPLLFLEQHTWIDLDGDGYQEPYTLTVEANSKKLVRLVARWDRPEDVERNAAGRILRINATEDFTKYGLIPSPDGSVYDMGFGLLLGPLNESVNSLVNQLIDAGTMAVAAGGFLARGVKIRGGAFTFQPFGWQRVDSTGDDLSKGIVPLPVREPSNVLFQLLSFLVNYAQRVGGASDAVTGENPGQNTPAQTQQSMVEQGTKIYSALFKRIWRCMKGEFGKLYILNAKHMPAEKSFGIGGKISREDFLGDPSQIVPVADPNITSDMMRLQQALTIADRSHSVPGYDIEATERNLLAAMKIDGVDVLYPGPDKAKPLPNPKLQVEEAKQKGKMQIEQAKLEASQREFIMTLQSEQQVQQASVIEMMAHAELMAAQAETAESGKQVELINAMIGAARARSDHLRGQIELAITHMEAGTNRIEAEAKRDAPATTAE